MTARVPELLVEQLRRGELGEAQAADVRRRLAQESGGLQRLERLADDDAATLAALPPEAFARRLRASRPRPVALWAVPALVFAAALLVVGPRVTAPPDPLPPETTPGVTHTKGDVDGLRVYRRVDDGVEALAAGAHASAGDHLQLSYYVSRPGHGVIFSVDGRGSVTLHFPDEGGSTALTPGAEITLPHGYVLDDAPRFETFVMLRADHPIGVEAALAVAREAGADGVWRDSAGGQVEVERVLVAKERP